MNNQSSTAVYGLFLEGDEGDILLGLYSSRGSADVARQEYIEEEVSDFDPNNAAQVRKTYEATVYVAQLPVGSKPDFYFVKR